MRHRWWSRQIWWPRKRCGCRGTDIVAAEVLKKRVGRFLTGRGEETRLMDELSGGSNRRMRRTVIKVGEADGG
jgi:hypothetical protein